jgi:hypothetical protein
MAFLTDCGLGYSQFLFQTPSPEETREKTMKMVKAPLFIIAVALISLVFVFLMNILWRWNRTMSLINAAQHGDLKRVQKCLQEGTPVDAEWRGLNAIEFAVYRGHEDVARLLLDSGADPKQALYQAVNTRNVKMVELLLQYGADPDWKCEGSRGSPREVAQMGNFTEIIAVMDKHKTKK